MKFKNLINESVIDSLNLSKIDKAMLKSMNSVSGDKVSYGTNVFDMTDAQLIHKIAEMFNSEDYQKIYSLYKMYKKYKDILFIDTDKLNFDNNTLDFSTDEEVIESIIFKFVYDRYNGEIVYSNGSHIWYLESMMSPEEADMEESHSFYLINNEEPQCLIYFGITPNKDTGKIGIDYITQDENFMEYNSKYIKGDKKQRFDDVIDSLYLSKISYPKDLNSETLKNYIDSIIKALVEEVIKPNEWKLDEYNNNK